MGLSVDHLTILPSGRLAFRKAFPEELRPHIGKRELKVSLKTKVKREALARYHAAEAEYERLVSLARKEASGTFDPLDEPKIAYLAALYHQQALESDDLSRFDPSEDELHAAIIADLEERKVPFGSPWSGREPERRWAKRQEALEAYQAVLKDAYAKGNANRVVELLGEEVKYFLEGQTLRIDPASEQFRLLCWEILKASIKATEGRLARNSGTLIATPAAPEIPKKAKRSEPQSTASFSSVIETVLKSPRKPIKASTAQATRTALRFFLEVVGDLPASAISRRDVADWLDMYAQRPVKLPASQRSWTLPRLAKHYDGRDVQRVAAKTLDVGVQALSARWSAAWKDGLLDTSLSFVDNPFRHHDTRSRISRPAENPGYSPDQLNAIFALPVFTRHDRPTRGKGEASYWLPLILLFTGCRPEEAAQLLVEDITEEDGRSFLTITNQGHHPTKGKRTLKTERSGTGIRTFPIPQPLLDLGFLEYVSWLRKRNEQALFPLLKPTGERHQLFAKWGEWWSGYLKAQGVPLRPDPKAARDFRHTWTTAARVSGLTEEEREYIQGHSTAGKSANVGYGERNAHGDAINRLRFKGFNVGQIAPWRAPQ